MIGRFSIRSRVLAAMAVVILLTTTIAFVIVDSTFNERERASVSALLEQSLEYAKESSRQPDMQPQKLVAMVDSNQVNSYLELTDGRTFGEAPLPGSLTDSTLLTGSDDLSNATLSVWHPAGELDAEQLTLRRTLLVIGVLALLLGSALTYLISDVALKPLQVMADRADQIAQGERGIRMAAPTDATEVGRTARAVDSMLDELEGAERRARIAEGSARRSAEQMQSFLSDAAHELKTPLAGIQAAADSLIQLPSEAQHEREQLAFLLAREANRGGHLVSSLLESARVDAGVALHPELLDLLQLAEAEQTRMGLAYPSVKVFVDGPALDVEGDRNAITSVLRNLIDNAGRAAAPDGWLVIDLSTRPASHTGPAMAVVTVMDSGPGIPPEDRERAFRRLVRLASTATTTKGSGLGLAIARGYARAHGGDVEIVDSTDVAPPQSASGQPEEIGAIFEVSLPLAAR